MVEVPRKGFYSVSELNRGKLFFSGMVTHPAIFSNLSLHPYFAVGSAELIARRRFLKDLLRKILWNLQEHLCRNIVALQPVTLLKRDSDAAVFMWVLRNFLEHIFYWTSPSAYMWIKRAVLCEVRCSRRLNHFEK